VENFKKLHKILPNQDFEYKPQSSTLKQQQMEEGREQKENPLC